MEGAAKCLGPFTRYVRILTFRLLEALSWIHLPVEKMAFLNEFELYGSGVNQKQYYFSKRTFRSLTLQDFKSSPSLFVVASCHHNITT